MRDFASSMDPCQWFGRLQRAYLASREESVLDELTDIGRLLAVTGIPVESVLETHSAVLAEGLAQAAGRAPEAVIEDATICLSEVLVAWRIAAEGIGEPAEAGGDGAPEPAIFLRFDGQGRFTGAEVEAGMGAVVGGLPDGWPARTLDQALDALGVGQRRDEVREAIGQRRLMAFAVHPLSAAGRAMRAVVCPFRDGSGIVGVHDVSARHAAAEAAFQRRKLESLGQLAGGIAHEINNLLQPILIAAQFVCEDYAGNAELMADARIILDSARAAAGVVSDVLAFAHRGPPQLTPLRLAGAVQRELAALRHSAPPLATIAADGLDEAAAVNGNACELGQVLRNLVGNAIDAMNGVGTVTVSVARVALDEPQAQRLLLSPGSYVRLSVADEGRGIDPQTAHRIFDPFFTTKAIGKGTGLGLAIVRGIVQSWGGTILLRAGVVRGTVFDILLPAVAEVAPECGGCPAGAAETPLPDATVMVVDDDVAVAAVIARTLRRAGLGTRVFHSAADALANFDAVRPHLVVSDLIMPGLDGLTLVGEVRRRHGHIPTIVLTGGGQGGEATDDLEARAEQAGVETLLFKPIDGERLLAAVRQCLNDFPVRQAEMTK